MKGRSLRAPVKIDLVHGWTLAGELAERGRALYRAPQPAVLGLELAALAGTLERDEQLFGLEGLGHVVECTGSHGTHCGSDAPEGGHHHDRGVGTDCAKFREELEAVRSRHLDVAEDHVAVPLAHLGQGLLAGACRLDLETGIGQEILRHLEDGSVVVDHEDRPRRRRGPGAPSGCFPTGGALRAIGLVHVSILPPPSSAAIVPPRHDARTSIAAPQLSQFASA
jgi:hypothetical protein